MTKFNLTPICIYPVKKDETVDYTESFGQLFYLEVETLDELPDFEIKEIKIV